MIEHKKEFSIGLILTISFFVVLFIIYSPVFPGKRNGLEYADMIFNRMAKGSTYYIPAIMEKNEKFIGKEIDVSITMKGAEEVEKVSRLYLKAGATIAIEENNIKIAGDLGTMLKSALADSDAMFKNKGDEVSERYGYDEKEAMYYWWLSFHAMDKALKKQKKFAEAAFILDVLSKAVEPGYNFYGIKGESAREHAGILTGSLVFYVIYTLWWGFAIYFLFEGFGLKMVKAKEKKEV
ncbi:MAG: hypothetical protein AMJ45_03240 [Syntrophobacter sp. DG_60]|nr:MAG: hypothetical protein AMJ45_03240 [Syntrophobacter sp. DG_60]